MRSSFSRCIVLGSVALLSSLLLVAAFCPHSESDAVYRSETATAAKVTKEVSCLMRPSTEGDYPCFFTWYSIRLVDGRDLTEVYEGLIDGTPEEGRHVRLLWSKSSSSGQERLRKVTFE